MREKWWFLTDVSVKLKNKDILTYIFYSCKIFSLLNIYFVDKKSFISYEAQIIGIYS